MRVMRWFRWGVSALAVEDHFATKEVKHINKECERVTRVYSGGEGYQASKIPLPLFEYGFVLIYSYEEELWVLELESLPDFDSPDCRRRPPRARRCARPRADERSLMDDPEGGPLAWILQILYETPPVGPMLAPFRDDLAIMIEIVSGRALSAARPATAPAEEGFIAMFTNLAVQPSHVCGEFVRFVQDGMDCACDLLGSSPTVSRAGVASDCSGPGPSQ